MAEIPVEINSHAKLRACLRRVGQTMPVLAAIDRLLKDRPDLTGESCIAASSAVTECLRELRLVAVVLEGELAITPKSWLQHRIVIVETEDRWLLVDLAVRQVPWLADKDLMILVMPSSRDILYNALETHYRWWISSRAPSPD